MKTAALVARVSDKKRVAHIAEGEYHLSPSRRGVGGNHGHRCEELPETATSRKLKSATSLWTETSFEQGLQKVHEWFAANWADIQRSAEF
jgi:hypothetical protein